MIIAQCRITWSKESFLKILNISKNRCKYFVFISRNAVDQENELLKKLSQWYVDTYETYCWPGTIHFGKHPAKIYKYNLCAETINILNLLGLDILLANNREFEDLSLLLDDGTPWFISITHEKEAMFKITDKNELGVLNFNNDEIEIFEDISPGEKY